MEKLKIYLNQYFWLVVMLFVFIIGFLAFSLSAAYENKKFNKTITNQSVEANKAVFDAANANADASYFATGPRAEASIRAKTRPDAFCFHHRFSGFLAFRRL